MSEKRTVGWHHLEETKQKIAETKRGSKASEETKQKLSEMKMGHVVSDETRQKLSDANKGKTLSVEVREKISKAKLGCVGPNIGRKFSEESCQKMAASRS